MTIALPETVPLAPFGCEIIGMDFTKDLHPDHAAAIRRAWVEHGVVLFRGAIPDDDAHLRLSRCLGEPQPAVTKKLNSEANPCIMVLDYTEKSPTNIYEVHGEQRCSWLGWHWDQAFAPEIVRGGCLRSTGPAKTGGQTGFIHVGDAYDRLSPKMKDRIDELEVVYHFQGAQEKNLFGYPKSLKLVARSQDQIDWLEKYDKEFPPVVHPLVVRLPENGRKLLKLSPMHARYILGMDAQESFDLLTELGEHIVEDRFAYYHDWQLNDVVAWDNWSVIHMACGVPPNTVRRAQRTTIAGDYKLGRYLDPSLDRARHTARLID